MKYKVTVLIPAFNASKTIVRAISSALPQVDQVIVVNDGSNDLTLATIKALNNDKITVINFKENRGVGAARQACLMACKTHYAAWLDSDDIFLPGRINNLCKHLDAGYGWVYAGMEIHDGLAGNFIAQEIIPKAVRKSDGSAFLLGRNIIKGVGVSVFNVEKARKIGFSTLRNCEDVEHLLNAIISGGHIYFSKDISYRQYKYPSSLTASVDNEMASASTMYTRLDKTLVFNFIESSSLCDMDKWSIKAYFLSNKNDWIALLNLCQTVDKKSTDEVRWLANFFAGVAQFQSNNFEKALPYFKVALQIKRTPDLLNNTAVTRQKLNLEYEKYLHEALKRIPHFRNAEKNLNNNAAVINAVPLRINSYVDTQHPLLQSIF